MKLRDLIKEHEGLEDFEVEIIMRDEKHEGVFPAYKVFEVIVEDVGYSNNVIRLGFGKEL